MCNQIDRWNWGAFLLTWIWGIGNGTFVAFLALVPFLNLVMPFVLGAKGSAWAWRNRQWQSVAEFRRTQKKWAFWGAVVWVCCLVACCVLFVGIFASLKNSEAYALAVNSLSMSSDARALLGEPISTGIPTGSIEVNGSAGTARLSFSASGPRGKGTVYLDARKEVGEWRLERAILKDEETGQEIKLVP